MKNKCNLIISLISEQTMPDIQFIKWMMGNGFKAEETNLLFITTQKMEISKKTESIKKTLELSGYSFKAIDDVYVEPNDPDNIKSGISTWLKGKKFNKIAANITCGTKLMSMAVAEKMKKVRKAEIYYIPLQGELLRLYPRQSKIEADVPINLYECMTASGYEITQNKRDCLMSYEFNKSFFSNCVEKNKMGMKLLGNAAAVKRNDDGTFDFTQLTQKNISNTSVEQARNIINYCGFDQKAVTGRQINYFMGAWYEELCYQKVMDAYKPDKDSIGLNVKSTKDNVPNEFDVIFMDQGVLHLIECKSIFNNPNPHEVILPALYKLQSNKSRFGLKTKAHLITNAKSKEISQTDWDRAKLYDIEIIEI